MTLAESVLKPKRPTVTREVLLKQREIITQRRGQRADSLKFTFTRGPEGNSSNRAALTGRASRRWRDALG